MSKVSFTNPGVPAEAEVTPQDAPTQRADENGNPVPPNSVTDAVAERTPAFPFNEDNIGFGDIKFPKLHITQKVGQLSNVFTPGEIILNLQLPIYTAPVLNQGVIVKAGTEPLYIVTVGFRKDRYAEQVAQDSDVQGILCNTLEEVAKANGTLNYNEHRAKKAAGIPSREFKTLATALFLVRKPKDVQDPDRILFPFVCEDEQYVLATLDMKGGSFTNGAQVIRQAKKIGHLNAGGYSSFSWSLGTLLKQWQTGNSSFIPVFKPGTKTSEVLREFIKNITGN
jgi:hypothetical protein